MSGRGDSTVNYRALSPMHSNDFRPDLRRVGEVAVIPSAFHGFDVVAPRADIVRSFYESQCVSLRQAFTAK
jgi:hypothetical protein